MRAGELMERPALHVLDEIGAGSETTSLRDQNNSMNQRARVDEKS